jgi:tRNA(fMet)-specific endonuclease VapC
MSGEFLLDTNLVIALFAGESSVQRHFSRDPRLFLPTIVVGELWYGALRSARKDENLRRVTDMASSVAVLSCDVETARHYGEVKDRLRQKGRPIPENDLWIAAVALQYNLILVSRDAHFDEIEGLNRQTW